MTNGFQATGGPRAKGCKQSGTVGTKQNTRVTMQGANMQK
jgi:hypothetical protein